MMHYTLITLSYREPSGMTALRSVNGNPQHALNKIARMEEKNTAATMVGMTVKAVSVHSKK